MSMPNIPDLNPNVSINRDDTLNLILSSIGMEELSMAHIVNAEAEKIQFALGTLETANGQAASMDQIMAVNNSSNRMLRDVIKNQMLIGMKMEEVVSLAVTTSTTTTPEETATKEEDVVVEEETTKEEAVVEEEKVATKEEAETTEEEVIEEEPQA